VELWVLLSFRWPQSLKRSLWLSFAAQFSGKAHKDSDYTATNAVMYWHLDAETHPDGEVVSRIYLIPLCKRRESRITITLKVMCQLPLCDQSLKVYSDMNFPSKFKFSPNLSHLEIILTHMQAQPPCLPSRDVRMSPIISKCGPHWDRQNQGRDV